MYQEHPDSTFTHGGSVGHRYDLNRLLRCTAYAPVELIEVPDVKWVLDYDEPDPIRVDAADLTAPALVVWDEEIDKFVVVDGLHRLARAVREGVQRLPCKFVSDIDLAECRY